MRLINEIFIHCTATLPEMDIDIAQVKTWHLDRGWSDVGYHFLVRRSGEVETGRPLHRAGAHVKGHNESSIGVAMAGGLAHSGKQACNYTRQQWDSLSLLIDQLQAEYDIPNGNVRGHNQASSKDCPCFDVTEWMKSWKN